MERSNSDDTNGLIDLTEIPSEYAAFFGEPEIVGWNYEFNIRSKYYSEFLVILEDEISH